jgi:hypothetical protein
MARRNMPTRLPDQQAGAPRRPVTEQLEEPLASELREPPSSEEVRALIAEAAYRRARQRGFTGGYQQRDWIEAEAEVMTKLDLWE